MNHINRVTDTSRFNQSLDDCQLLAYAFGRFCCYRSLTTVARMMMTMMIVKSRAAEKKKKNVTKTKHTKLCGQRLFRQQCTTTPSGKHTTTKTMGEVAVFCAYSVKCAVKNKQTKFDSSFIDFQCGFRCFGVLIWVSFIQMLTSI